MLLAIVALVAAGVSSVEVMCRARGLPSDEEKNVYRIGRTYNALIIGDSRAYMGLAPQVFERELGLARVGNMADLATSPINQLQLLSMMGAKPKMIIIAVSPASIYGTFYRERKSVAISYWQQGPSLRNWIRRPYDNVEQVLSRWIKRSFKFTLGSKCIGPLLAGSPLQESTGPDGWGRSQPTGEERAFHRMANEEAYRNRFLENSHGTLQKRDGELVRAMKDLKLGSSFWSVMVRLPCSPELRRMEDEKFPDFDSRMSALAKTLGLNYYCGDFGLNPRWDESDSTHLIMPDAIIYSEKLAMYIRSGSSLEKRTVR